VVLGDADLETSGGRDTTSALQIHHHLHWWLVLKIHLLLVSINRPHHHILGHHSWVGLSHHLRSTLHVALAAHILCRKWLVGDLRHMGG
jgi:hypothetical protein